MTRTSTSATGGTVAVCMFLCPVDQLDLDCVCMALVKLRFFQEKIKIGKIRKSISVWATTSLLHSTERAGRAFRMPSLKAHRKNRGDESRDRRCSLKNGRTVGVLEETTRPKIQRVSNNYGSSNYLSTHSHGRRSCRDHLRNSEPGILAGYTNARHIIFSHSAYQPTR